MKPLDPIDNNLQPGTPKMHLIPGNDAQLNGKQYHAWLRNVYQGVLTWYEDESMGGSFQERVVHEDGTFTRIVYSVDKWELFQPSSATA